MILFSSEGILSIQAASSQVIFRLQESVFVCVCVCLELSFCWIMSCEDFHAECAEGGSPYDPFVLLMEVYNPF